MMHSEFSMTETIYANEIEDSSEAESLQKKFHFTNVDILNKEIST